MRSLRVLANTLGILGLGILLVPATHVATGIQAQSGIIESRFHRFSPRGSSTPLAVGQAWGQIEIPRVGLDEVVFEGDNDATLRKGPGHLPETAVPASLSGNCVIAGHRDSFFHRLASVREGDLVFVRALDGTFATYRLESRRVVLPENVSVLDPSTERRLTLITCYPFHWVGAAPYRLVWTGVAVGRRTTGSPSSGG
jgi:sortase A